MAENVSVYVSCGPGWDYSEEFVKVLRSKGYAVSFRERARIRIGEDVQRSERKARERSMGYLRKADYVIWIFTQSDRDSAGREEELAEAVARELNEQRTILLPVIAENTTVDSPALVGRAVANITNYSSLGALIDALSSSIEDYSAERAAVAPSKTVALRSLAPTEVEFDDDLIHSMREGNCVLYAGAGLSAPAGLPIWNQFAEKLVQSAAEWGILSGQDRQFLAKALQGQRADYVVDEVVGRARSGFLIATLPSMFLGRKITAAHSLLGEMPFTAALTTNFDDLLEQTFAAPMSGAQSYTPKDAEALLGSLTKKQFFLLKLYGALDRPETLLVSPAQFDDAVSENQPFRSLIESLFVSRTILFVGCSLEGIETYLRGLRFKGQSKRRHYALSGVIGTSYEPMAGVLLRRYNIQVVPYRESDEADLLNAVRILSERVKTRAADRSGATDDPELRSGVLPLRRVVLNNVGPFRAEQAIVLDPRVTVFLGNNGTGKSTLLRALGAAICGADSAPYAVRLLGFGAGTASILLETERSSYQFVMQRTTAGVEVTSLPVRPLEPEGWLVIGFPPLRTISGLRSQMPQTESVAVANANDILPLLQGPIDQRLDDVQSWIVNLDYRAKDNPNDTRFRRALEKFFEIAGVLATGTKLQFQEVDSSTRRIHVLTDDGPTPLDALSQGTASLLACVGVLVQRLYEVYGADEDPTHRPVITLMDEIDAHMHPAWQITLISRLLTCFPAMQLIATTHSPLIVMGLEKQNVYRMVRTGEDRHVEIRQYEMKLKGQEIDDLLTSPLFGLDDTRDIPTIDAERRYDFLSAQKNLSAEQAAKRDALEMQLFGPQGSYAKLHKDLDGRIEEISKEEQLRRVEAGDEIVRARLSEESSI
jgi:hypothetical protein